MQNLLNLTAPLRRNPDVTKLWFGQMLSQIGTKMYQIALVWWFVTEFANQSGVMIGWLLVSGVVPGIFFVKWIGQKVEKSELRSLILKSDLMASIVCFLLLMAVLKGVSPPWAFYVASFILAFCQSVIDPAVNKILPRISKTDDLTFSIALISSSTTFASFLGALFGALAIAAIGIKGALAVNALSYVVSFYICSRLHKIEQVHEGDAVETVTLKDVVKNHWFYCQVMLVFASINLFLTPVLITMPIFVNRVFNGGAYTLAMMEAFLWAGMLTGAFATSLLGKIKDVLIIGFVLLSIVGSSLVLGGVFENIFLYSLCMCLMGLALGLLNVKFMAYFQEKIPDHDKGRFFALFMATINFMTPVGFLGFGVLVDHYSVKALTVTQGLGVLVVGTSFLLLRRREVKG